VRGAVVWLLAGCSFSPQSAQSDARSTDASAPSDAAIDASGSGSGSGSARDCNALWKAGTIAFATPQPIAELDTQATERDPFLSPDELTIYFSQEHPIIPAGVDADIIMATRAMLGSAFAMPMPFAAASTPQFYESKMSISIDQLALVVCRSDGSGGNNVQLGVRGSAGDPWPALSTMYLDNVDAPANAYDPELGATGAQLIYAPSDTGVTQHLASAAQPSATSDYLVGSIPGYTASQTLHDADPWLDASGSVLVFSRGTVGSAEIDIYYALADGSGTFGAPVELSELGSAGYATGDPWVSADGCRMYLSSNRGNADGSYDLYTAVAN
jgi:WD40-like Beta Propeller Repeat